MKKKFISFIVSASMFLCILSANAVSISFENIDEIRQTEETNLYEEVFDSEIIEIQNDEIYIDKNSLEINTISSEATDYGIMTTAIETQYVSFGNILTVPSHGCGSTSKSWSSSEYSLDVLGSGNLYFTVGGINCGSNIDYAGLYVYDTNRNLLTYKTFKPVGKYGGGSYNTKTLSIPLTKGNYIIKAISNHPNSCSASIKVYANVLNVYFSGTYETKTSYTVKYYKMDLNGNYVLDETVTDTVTIGTEVTPEVKEYIGFTSPKPITKTVLADGSTLIEYYYKRNKYTVTYIDKTPDGKEIGRTEKIVYYDTDVRGSELGDDPLDNAYYLQYKYISDTNAKVITDGTTVYRIFELCETEAISKLHWNDNNNLDGFRPQKYKLKLKQNGKVIDEVELPSKQTDYTFPDLPKYDEAGNLYHYTFDVDASDRYKINFDNNGNLIIEDYQPANFSVIIPKQIVLDGNTGEASYTVSVNGTFYYNDTLTVIPEKSLTLSDRSNISTMKANVSLTQTHFSKEDISSVVNGIISTDKKLFAGKWNGSFNFDIKFVMQN